MIVIGEASAFSNIGRGLWDVRLGTKVSLQILVVVVVVHIAQHVVATISVIVVAGVVVLLMLMDRLRCV